MEQTQNPTPPAQNVTPQPPSVASAPPPQHKNAILPILLTAIFFLLIGLAGGYMYATNNTFSPFVADPTPTDKTASVSPSPLPTTIPLTRYANDKYAYTLQHPSTWSVKEEEFLEATMTVLSTPDGKEALIIYGNPPGRGCGPTDPTLNKRTTFEFNNQTLEVGNFCGTNTYIITVINPADRPMAIDINFVGTPYEKEGREILKSIEGLVPVDLYTTQPTP